MSGYSPVTSCWKYLKNLSFAAGSVIVVLGGRYVIVVAIELLLLLYYAEIFGSQFL